MRSLVAVALVAVFLSFSLSASGAPEPATQDEERRGYVGGGSAMGARAYCLPDATGFDILAACHVRCPGNTCNITVIDDVRGSNIGFRICFDGETFCRPHGYWGTADVPGSKVTVVPLLEHGTHGVVIVR